MRCSGILFDLDGVLVDSAQCVRQVCTDWAVARGLDPAMVLRVGQGRRAQDMVRAAAPHLDVDAEVAELVEIEARTTRGLYAVPGAEALIASLAPNAWAVVTSGARAVATLRLSHVGLPLPQILITADDVTHGKPHPEGYLAAACALGLDPGDCVVVEDAPPGIAAARAAAIRSIGVAGNFPADALSEADVVIPALGALRITATGPEALQIDWD